MSDQVQTLTRDQIRSQIFSSKAQGEVIDFFGVKVEVRQPGTGQLLDTQDAEINQGRKHALLRMLVNFVYVPGTNVNVFEEADADAILELPFNQDMAKLNKTFAQLTGVKIDDESKSGSEAAT